MAEAAESSFSSESSPPSISKTDNTSTHHPFQPDLTCTASSSSSDSESSSSISTTKSSSENVARVTPPSSSTPKPSPPPEEVARVSPLPDSSSTSFSLVEANPRPCGVELVSSARTNKRADPNDLVALAMQVQRADERTRSVAGSKLSVIAEQIQFLQKQAAKILEETRLNAELNHAACNMVKKPGTVYHLYERDTGQKYLSILSPQEWGASCPHGFLGSYRLEYDMSWTPMDKRKERNSDEAMVTNILKAHRLVGPANAANHAQELSRNCDDSNFKPLMTLLDKADL